VFYYDCVDYQLRDGETVAQRDLRIEPRVTFLAQIDAMPGVRVREGTVKGKGGKDKRRQKQVDTMLSVDMLTHALHKNIGKVVLVAGDLDFLPAVESLVRAGVYVRLMGERTHTAPELIDETDEFLELDYNELINWAHGLSPNDKINKAVRYETTATHQENELRRGELRIVSGKPIQLYWYSNYCVLVHSDGALHGASCRDAGILTRWLERKFSGTVHWQ
jgi:uncharacterized LabA/DUF88 family protein